MHAQERTWQLEFNRRVMHGELSEVFGPATLETDKLMRTLDIMGTAKRQYAGLPLYAQEALQATARASMPSIRTAPRRCHGVPHPGRSAGRGHRRRVGA